MKRIPDSETRSPLCGTGRVVKHKIIQKWKVNGLRRKALWVPHLEPNKKVILSDGAGVQVTNVARVGDPANPAQHRSTTGEQISTVGATHNGRTNNTTSSIHPPAVFWMIPRSVPPSYLPPFLPSFLPSLICKRRRKDGWKEGRR